MAESETGKRIALLVDGENISADHAGFLITRSVALGRLTICRVYGNAAKLPKWDAAPGFRLIHSGTGKNATDILMIVEAMELALGGQADEIVIASSDADFVPLLRHLKERGVPVHLIGEAKASEALRKSSGRFIEIPVAAAKVPKPASATTNGVTVTDEILIEYLCNLPEISTPDGMLISAINPHAKRDLNVKISERPARKWHTFLTAHSSHFYCFKNDNQARVKLKSRGPTR